MATILELLSGVLRYFPSILTVTLLVVGILTAKLSWIVVAAGGILVAIVALTFQYVLQKAFGVGPIPGAAILEACSLLPTTRGDFYVVPSVWMSMSIFYSTYIFLNALNIYKSKPEKKSVDALPVQQRKGLGLISMLAILLLFVVIVGARFVSPCESTGGTLFALLIGIGGAYGWWQFLTACGADVYPDIHGVMIGLKPGDLRTQAKVCTRST
jgi:hypothetical protein